MSAPSRTPNPHLAAYYGIITSAFVSLIVILAMFEQLGWSEGAISRGMILLPLVFYVLVAAGSRTFNIEDYFASGRRVPPVYNALVLAATAVGGVGFFSYTGTLFFLGFDGLAIGLGWVCGLLLAGVLFVPYLRKAGAFTLPSFLGQRFRSREVRLGACVMQVPPTALLLAAEIKIAALVASLFLPLSFSVSVFLVAALVATTAILGGMRGLTWTGSAQFIVGAVGLTVTLVVVSILLTNLPAPQFTYGGLFTSLQNAEITAGLSPVQAGEETVALPDSAPKPVVKPFFQPFVAIGETGFIMLFLCFTFGTAALPSLLVRSGVTPSVHDQRRSSAWALLLVTLFVITAPSMAAFAKLLMLEDITVNTATVLPPWLSELSGWQLLKASDLNGDGGIGAGELLIVRDGIALSLPMLSDLPYVLTVLMAAAGMAIALAAAGSHLFTLAASLADDLYKVIDRRLTALPRLMAVWAAIAATVLSLVVFLLIAEVDPLRVAVTAFAFAAATFFAVLLLGIWWPRCSVWGALTAMGIGFVTFLVGLIVGSLFSGSPSVTTATVSVVSMVLAFAGGIAVSLYGPAASAAQEAYWEEMRNPEGEAIFDRAQQRAAAAAATTSGK